MLKPKCAGPDQRIMLPVTETIAGRLVRLRLSHQFDDADVDRARGRHDARDEVRLSKES